MRMRRRHAASAHTRTCDSTHIGECACMRRSRFGCGRVAAGARLDKLKTVQGTEILGWVAWAVHLGCGVRRGEVSSSQQPCEH